MNGILELGETSVDISNLAPLDLDKTYKITAHYEGSDIYNSSANSAFIKTSSMSVNDSLSSLDNFTQHQVDSTSIAPTLFTDNQSILLGYQTWVCWKTYKSSNTCEYSINVTIPSKYKFEIGLFDEKETTCEGIFTYRNTSSGCQIYISETNQVVSCDPPLWGMDNSIIFHIDKAKKNIFVNVNNTTYNIDVSENIDLNGFSFGARCWSIQNNTMRLTQLSLNQQIYTILPSNRLEEDCTTLDNWKVIGSQGDVKYQEPPSINERGLYTGYNQFLFWIANKITESCAIYFTATFESTSSWQTIGMDVVTDINDDTTRVAYWHINPKNLEELKGIEGEKTSFSFISKNGTINFYMNNKLMSTSRMWKDNLYFTLFGNGKKGITIHNLEFYYI